MRTALTALGLLLLSTGFAAAQPVITGGPVSAASYAVAGQPNFGIAQGSLFTLFGRSLGPGQLLQANAFPLPATLGGTSIRVTVGGTSVSAIMIYTLFGQVAAILPSSTPVGDGTLTLAFNNQTSAPVPMRVVRSSFGIFTRNSAGTGPAIAQNFNSATDLPLNTLVQAAQPGQVLVLWGTGLGAVSGNEAGGPLPGDLGGSVDVFVGNKPANIFYRGRSGCCAGVDQVSFAVPAGVEGCNISVVVRAGGVVSNFGTIAVASSGRFCSDPTGFSAADLQKLQAGVAMTVADTYLLRIHVRASAPGVGTVEGNLDTAEGHLTRYAGPGALLASTRGSAGGLGTAGGVHFPSLGSCVVYPYSYRQFGDAIAPRVDDPVNLREVDAGPVLNLAGPRGNKQIPRHGSGQIFEYFPDSFLGGGIPGFTPVVPDYLEPGSYTVDDSSGGPDVGAFRATLTIPSSQPVWTNQDAISSDISRSQDLTINWSGGAAGGFVGVIGSTADPKTGAGAGFECAARAEAGTFTVPAWVLSALPATGIDPSVGLPAGFLSLVTTLPQPSRFQATGIDVGFFNWGALQTKIVNFQ